MKIKKLHKEATIPQRIHKEDAGLDLYAIHPAILDLGIVTKVGTGIAIEIPNNHVGLILDRSSLGSKGIKVLGGVIDSNYRGEIIVMLSRVATPDYDSNTEYRINIGDKIAQLVIIPIIISDIEVVEELTNTSRGDNGFGSTGV